MTTLWPHQKFALQEVPRLITAGHRRTCVTSPTGGGKTVIVCELLQWVLAQGLKAILYTNRRMLTNQIGKVLDQRGIPHGVRASGYQDRRELPVQISSLPTENQRVLKAAKWSIHGEDGRFQTFPRTNCHKGWIPKSMAAPPAQLPWAGAVFVKSSKDHV